MFIKKKILFIFIILELEIREGISSNLSVSTFPISCCFIVSLLKYKLPIFVCSCLLFSNKKHGLGFDAFTFKFKIALLVCCQAVDKIYM